MLKATSCSTCIVAAVVGAPQRGIVHSAFDAAANIVFPGDFVLSLNAGSSSRMPNGLEISAAPGAFPFCALRTGMPVLFGAQRLHIEAIGCSLDLSLCTQWNPHIECPEVLDKEIVRKNRERLIRYIHESEQGEGDSQGGGKPLAVPADYHPTNQIPQFPYIHNMAQILCGRGVGLTPTGDDILAGWMAAGWLLYGPMPGFLAACQQIVEVAKRQTHLLSQCWLRYAAEGNVAQPICALLDALTHDDQQHLSIAAEVVLAMGATSGHDLIQGMLLMLNEI